ncbi:MAG: ATP-grasp domain-containing protein [Planctomycetota bacterium]|nr:ATP-grasp domain-containing protein [Planctomycetota bacterium]
MSSGPPRVLVFEFICGGGCFLFPSFGSPSGSLLEEGREMLQAVLEEIGKLNDLEVVTCLDQRLQPRSDFIPSADVHTIGSTEQLRDFFRTTSNQVDWMLLIAPEIDGALSHCLRHLAGENARLLSPNLATVEICADKWKTHQFLTEHQIPTPRTRLLSHNFTDRESPWKADHRLIVKPRWGAGSQGVAMLTGAEAIHKREQPDADKYLVQAWTSGIPASIAVSQSSHGRLIFPLMKQCLKPKTFEFVSCEGPLPDDMQKRAERLLNRIVTHLPEFSGYLGIDLLLGSAGDGSEDRVIEINPRFTTSFCVTRKLVKQNLFTDLLFPDRLSDRHSPPQHQETNP